MGVSCRCPRTGGLGQGQHLFLRRFLRSRTPSKTFAKVFSGPGFHQIIILGFALKYFSAEKFLGPASVPSHLRLRIQVPL